MTVTSATLALVSVCIIGAARAQATETPHLSNQTRKFNVRAPQLGDAIQSVCLAADIDCPVSDELLEREQRRPPRVVGDYTPTEALRKVLSRTRLTFDVKNSRTVSIRPKT